MRNLLSTAALPALLLVASGADAQQRRGFEDPSLLFVTATTGLGDCAGYDCDVEEANTGPLFGFGAGFYVRPIAFFAAGIDSHFNLIAADDRDDNRIDEIGHYWLFNLAARGIIPLGRVEPWGGVGFGFAGWNYYWTRPDGRDEARGLSGVDFAFSFGADVALTDQFWLGGMFRFAIPFWNDSCRLHDDGRDDCRSVDQLDVDDQHRLPDGLWYFGVTGRLDIDV
jgi:hypothetical protein